MAHARTTRSAGERTKLYEQITSRIIAELEAGCVPWVQPWGSSAASIGMPYNAVSDRRYSGINVLTLWDAIVSRGFASHAFLTFRQAASNQDFSLSKRRNARQNCVMPATKVKSVPIRAIRGCSGCSK
ncbi:hypothetical protein BRX37_03870 [Sphingomonas sp. S-NIH.Pt3_0716]|nr:hypothetical protein BRX37_03870 [Sphingomonas sp. S-NIH.Pt3_0716]